MHQNWACPCILVVEDEPSLARMLSRALCQAGCTVEVALSCEAALSINRTFQIGVFDAQLGDGCGVELSKNLLEKGQLERVVFFTASVDHHILELARPLGPIVSKRDGIEALLKVLAELIPPAAG